MRVEIFLDKPLEHSAAVYFERAKKEKKKLEGTRVALEKSRKELATLRMAITVASQKLEREISKPAKQEWYEKFRWFYSSEGFLCIGGRDATTNEILVKKHALKGDVVFHTKMEGSPFFIIKTDGKKPGQATLDEAAQATASYSRAWKLGMAALQVFRVNPDQLSKQAVETGANLPKGAFAVVGKMNLMDAKLEVALGIKEGRIIGGPVDAISNNSEKYAIILQGKESAGAIAKLIQKKLGGTLDEIIKFIPSGGAKLK